jgi:HEAT repeat protein
LERQVQVGEVDDLIARIQSADDQVRGAAWQGAASAGAAAIQPLARLLTHTNFEVARSAKHALYRVVRQAGRPGARRELGLSQAVQK